MQQGQSGVRTTRARRWFSGALALGLAGLTLAAGPASADTADRHRSGARARFVALGDSYASGEGLAPYQAGTDTATNQCHRSRLAYPKIVGKTVLRSLPRVTSVACSGAMTGALVAELPDSGDEPGQVRALKPTTRVVTLTIGGNDVGFAPVLASCTYTPVAMPQPTPVPDSSRCQQRFDGLVTAATARLAGLAGTAEQFPGTLTMSEALSAIHRSAPQARIYVTGYPRLFGLTFSSKAGCQVGQLGQAPLFVTAADAIWIRSKVDGLNAAIKAGVRQANGAGISATYVDVASTFTGHNVCSSKTPWINGVVFSGTGSPQLSPASFHPTARGQRAYAAAVSRAIEADRRHRTSGGLLRIAN
jgi:lysophospholipase L1-like esterase